MRMKCVLAVALALTASGVLEAQTASVNGSVERAVRSITPADIIHRIGVIAHDSMRGRATPSPELDQTARYIAAEFERFGLTPGGDDGDFIQHFPIVQRRLDLARSSVRITGGPTWRMGPDVLLHRGMVPDEGITGRAVIIAGSQGDLSSVGDVPVDGAVVFLSGPLAATGNLIVPLRERGAAAVVLVTTRTDSRWRAMRQGLERSRWEKGWGDFTGSPILEVREPTVAPVLAQHGHDAAARRRGPFTAQALPSLELTIHARFTTTTGRAPNVVGILEGSDPTLRNEYIVLSGHMDHVGVGRPVNGDSIYNGADDDASGTIAVVEAAEAFAMLDPRPKRSFVFLVVSGEEQGMWGSEFFSRNPPVPLANVVANFNTDMVGRNWPDTIVVIGKEHSDLGATLERVTRRHPELGMTAIDDLWPQERFYYRSDHINFARNGVPILFFFNGTHADYHRPSDHVDLIDAEKESRIVKLVFYLGLEVANSAARPQWNEESYRQIVGR